MVEVSEPCGACGKPVRGGDQFCEACGAKVPIEVKAALRLRLDAAQASSRSRAPLPPLVMAEHATKMSGGQRTIGALAILFLLAGGVYFYLTREQVEEALLKLVSASDGEPLVQAIAGASTVGELRAALHRAPYVVLGVNWFLAAVMAGLWVWSKRALLPAIISALGIYVAVQVASALVDPATLAQGIIMKVLIIGALAKGMQSALAARRFELAR